MFDERAYHRAYYKVWRENNQDKVRAYARKHYWKHRDKCIAGGKISKRKRVDKVRAYTAKYNLEHPTYAHDHYMLKKEHYQEVHRAYYLKVKHEVIDAYGGRCVCCGEKQWEYLTLDHINRRGKEADRDANGKSMTGYKLYVKLRSLGYPKDNYRLLCFKCNCVIGAFGYCPHEAQKRLFLEVVA